MRVNKIKVELITKQGKYHAIEIPSEMVICPCCEGRSKHESDCGLCKGLNVIEVASHKFLETHKRIRKGMDRFDNETQADAWERYGESLLGC